LAQVLSEGCLVAAGVSEFDETEALASGSVVCFAGVKDGEAGGVDELGAVLAAGAEDCGLAVDSFANGVLGEAAAVVD
jgi:hypothetical protein